MGAFAWGKSIALTLLLAGTATASSIIPTLIVIPDSEAVINFNSSGLDWVYAGPIAPNEFGSGQIEQASYRAAEGWRNATVAEWAVKPDWTDFIKALFVPGDIPGVESNHLRYKFTSEYWSTFTHVDVSDAQIGHITNGTTIGSLNGVWETWYVRDSLDAAAVPLPLAAVAGLTLMGGTGMARVRCRRRDETLAAKS